MPRRALPDLTVRMRLRLRLKLHGLESADVEGGFVERAGAGAEVARDRRVVGGEVGGVIELLSV